MNKRPIAVAANVLLSQNGELLMGLRSDCLKWEVPVGKVEDEELVDAAKREMMEECGVTLKGEPTVIGHADVYGTTGASRYQRYLVIFLLWKKWDGFPQIKDEHLRWRWFKWEEMPPAEQVTNGTNVLLAHIFPAYLKAQARVGEEVLFEPDDPDDESNNEKSFPHPAA